MYFYEVCQYFDRIEKIRGRLEMTSILAELFKKLTPEEVEKIVYIIEGFLRPPYEGIDLGLGEKFAIEGIASATGYSRRKVEELYKKTGDLGYTAEKLLEKKKQVALFTREMNISYVYDEFMRIAKASGKGSQQKKIKILAELLNNAKPIEGRYIVRFIEGELRLGIGEPTILDALSVAKVGDKSLREELDRAFNISSDLGYIARLFFEDPERIKNFKVQVFKPLMPALAERLSSPEEIIKKIGPCAVEYKFDGFRLQCHKKGDKVKLFSRKLEDMTHMFPDVVSAIMKLPVDEIIFEGEALAYNEKEGRYYSFQETMHRRRKHGIEEAAKELPLNIFVFDLMYLNGDDLTLRNYMERRKRLESIFPFNILKVSKRFDAKTAEDIEKIFEDSLNKKLEGIMAKDLKAPYTAGKRKFAWIKLKKSYGKSVDTIDAVIVGYYLGKGHRAEFEFGGLLVAVLNSDTGKLETIAKIGSGFTEEEMTMLKEKLEKIKINHPPSDLLYKIEPDFWVKPIYVVEVAFDEITRSPTHTCALKEEKGLALRFPRMVRFRDDKSVREITTTHEVEEMAALQHNS